jgi:hypothetical protein
MADGGSGGGDGAGAGGNNEDKVTFDGDQTTTSANSNPPPPPASGGGTQANPPPAAPPPATTFAPSDSGAGSGGDGLLGDSFGSSGLPILGDVGGLTGSESDLGSKLPIMATVDGLVGSASGIVDSVLAGGNADGLGGNLPIGSSGTGLVDTLLGGGDGKGVVGSLLGGNALASVTTSDQGANPGLNVDIGGANDGGAGSHGHALIDVNANTGSDGALGSVLGNGAGIADLGSLLDGQKLVDVHAGSSQGNGDALVNVNADTASALGAADGTVGSLLGKVAGMSDAGSLLNGQQLLNVDAGSGQGGSDALVNVHADPSTTLGGADGAIGSLLGAGDGVGDLGSVLNGQQLLNVDTGAGDGNSNALVNVHADPDTGLVGTDGTIGSLLGTGDGVGDLGSMLDAQHLVSVSPAPANGGAGAPVNVDTSGVDAANIVGDSGGMGLVAALVGGDNLETVDLPVVDTPHEVSVLDAPIADIHLQPDHA